MYIFGILGSGRRLALETNVFMGLWINEELLKAGKVKTKSSADNKNRRSLKTWMSSKNVLISAFAMTALVTQYVYDLITFGVMALYIINFLLPLIIDLWSPIRFDLGSGSMFLDTKNDPRSYIFVCDTLIFQTCSFSDHKNFVKFINSVISPPILLIFWYLSSADNI